MGIPKWLERFRDAFNWGWLAYRVIYVLAISGILSAVGGAVWAIMIGVPLPIAIMAGYCTFVGAVYLGIAPLAYRVLSEVPRRTLPAKARVAPDYSAWRHLDAYEMQDAAKLWCEVDPNSPSTNRSVAWYEVFKAKVIKREFEIVYKNSTRGYEYSEPNEFTKIKKQSLKKFAGDNGYDPIFLRDS
jgi:hypothetical protein